MANNKEKSMKWIGSASVGHTYSLEQKIKAVYYLLLNDRNRLKTALETGVTRGSLKVWEAKYGNKVANSINLHGEAVDSVIRDFLGSDTKKPSEKLEESKLPFIGKVIEVRNQAIHQLADLIPSEKDSKKVIEAIKVLTQIYNEEVEGGESPHKTGDEQDTLTKWIKKSFPENKASSKVN